MDFLSVFSSLHNSTCMIRVPCVSIEHIFIPIYILNTPALKERREKALSQLTGFCDITLVHCLNGEDVVHFSNETLNVLHPNAAITKWSKSGTRLRPGTLSLALKHLLAIYDMLQRHVPVAAIVEDDIQFSANFETIIAKDLKDIPSDAKLYHFASYSRVHQTFSSFPKYKSIRRRENASWIIGGTGYIVFGPTASEFLTPIVAPWDVQFSLQTHPIFSPQPSFGGNEFAGWPNPKLKGGTHKHLNFISRL